MEKIVSITFAFGRTALEYDSPIEGTELVTALGCIYMHAKGELERLSPEFGMNLIDEVEEKLEKIN